MADESGATSIHPYRLYAGYETDVLFSSASQMGKGGPDWYEVFYHLLNWTDMHQAPVTLMILVINELDVPLVHDDWADVNSATLCYTTTAAIPAMVTDGVNGMSVGQGMPPRVLGMPGVGVFGVEQGTMHGPCGALHFAPQGTSLPQGLTIGYGTNQVGSAWGSAGYVKLQTDTATNVANWLWNNATYGAGASQSSDTLPGTDLNGNATKITAESTITGSQTANIIAPGSNDRVVYCMVVRVRAIPS